MLLEWSVVGGGAGGKVKRVSSGVGVESRLGGGKVWLRVKSSPHSLAACIFSRRRTLALVPSSSILFSSN